MPLSGGGVKTRVNDFTGNAASDINPTALQFDQEFDDLDAAVNLVWFKDGRNAPTADMSMGGFVLENVGTAVLGTDALNRDTADARYVAAAARPLFPLNASITSSVAANALTIALKTAAGADASATDKILLPFRSATAATGSIEWVNVTAATSLVISSGSTLGTSNSVPFTIWIVAFNDAGTVRLGAVRTISSVVTDPLSRLSPMTLASSTAEGGAGNADTARVFYTGTAVTAKAYCILGFLHWGSGLATAGTWASDATVKQAYGPGVPLPGDIIQHNQTYDSGVATGTTQIPSDNTIPQNTEGDQYMSLAFSPLMSSSRLVVKHVGHYASSSTINGIGTALFQDSTVNASYAIIAPRNASAGAIAMAILETAPFNASNTTSRTYKIRAGAGAAGTTTFNGTGGAGFYGGLVSALEVFEQMT